MRASNTCAAALALFAMALLLGASGVSARKCGAIDSGYSISGEVLESYSIMNGYGYDSRARTAKTCRAACKANYDCIAWSFNKVQAKVSGSYCTLYSDYDSEDYEGQYSNSKHWAGTCY